MCSFYSIVRRKNYWENKLSKHITCFVDNYYQVDLNKICFECRIIIKRINYWKRELEKDLKDYE